MRARTWLRSGIVIAMAIGSSPISATMNQSGSKASCSSSA
jgi:hypothetical protein